jgi:hypothetical protein
MCLNYGSMAAKGLSASKIPSKGSGGTENMERSTSAGVLMTRRNVALAMTVAVMVSAGLPVVVAYVNP